MYPTTMSRICCDQWQYLWYNCIWGDDLDDVWYHMHIESCLGALHTFGEVVKCVIFDYVLGEHWWFIFIGELDELCIWWNL